LLKHRAILPRRGINGKNLEEEEEEPRKTRKMKRKMELEELSELENYRIREERGCRSRWVTIFFFSPFR